VKILSIALTFCLFLSVAVSTPAKFSKSKKSTPAPAADTSDKITAVHLTSITINVYATHAAKEYKVTPATKITVNGQPAQLNGLATGMTVVVAPAPDGVTAATIDAKTPKR
jgi:pectin methylesterase-like acyl-CoA thioesterase